MSEHTLTDAERDLAGQLAEAYYTGHGWSWDDEELHPDDRAACVDGMWPLLPIVAARIAAARADERAACDAAWVAKIEALPLAESICRRLHATRWEYPALSRPCDECDLAASYARLSSQHRATIIRAVNALPAIADLLDALEEMGRFVPPPAADGIRSLWGDVTQARADVVAALEGDQP